MVNVFEGEFHLNNFSLFMTPEGRQEVPLVEGDDLYISPFKRQPPG